MHSILEVVVPVIGAKADKYLPLSASKKAKIPLQSILYVVYPVDTSLDWLTLYQL